VPPSETLALAGRIAMASRRRDDVHRNLAVQRTRAQLQACRCRLVALGETSGSHRCRAFAGSSVPEIGPEPTRCKRGVHRAGAHRDGCTGRRAAARAIRFRRTAAVTAPCCSEDAVGRCAPCRPTASSAAVADASRAGRRHRRRTAAVRTPCRQTAPSPRISAANSGGQATLADAAARQLPV